MLQKTRYYFTTQWFKDVIYALCVLANFFVAAGGIGIGGADGYFLAFAGGSAVYFLVTNFTQEEARKREKEFDEARKRMSS